MPYAYYTIVDRFEITHSVWVTSDERISYSVSTELYVPRNHLIWL